MKPEIDSQIRATFDDIIARTPAIGVRPTHAAFSTTSASSSTPRPWLALAASATAILAIGGLVAIRSTSSNTRIIAPSATPAEPPTSAAVGTSSETESVPSTTTTLYGHTPQSVSEGSVVCVDAGATAEALGWCREEFGAPSIAARVEITKSVVMPISNSFEDIADAAKTAALVYLDVVPLDPTLFSEPLPPQSPAATTYLVIGTSNVPYESS